MWYTEDDEEIGVILDNIEKSETQKINLKQQQQEKEKESMNKEEESTMNKFNSRIIASSTDEDIKLPSTSPSSSPSPSPSPSLLSSQDNVFDLDEINSTKQQQYQQLQQQQQEKQKSTSPLTVSPTKSAENDSKKLPEFTSSPPTPTSLNISGGNNSSDSSENLTHPLKMNQNIMNNDIVVSLTEEEIKAIEIGKEVFCNFLKKQQCYDVIPISGKVVVLDTKLVVKSAFYALEENGIKSAPLWSSELQDFTGMITVSDFIDILLYYYRKPKSDNIFQDMGIHRIETYWREISPEQRPSKSLIYTEPETNLYDAASILLKYKIHRLPVLDKKDTNSILHILTHSRILAFMMKSMPDLPDKLLSIPIVALGIGTFNKVESVFTTTPLAQVLELLSVKKISAVPIIDEESSKIVDVYSKGDVTLMAKQGALSPADLDLPVHQVLLTFTKLWQRPEQIYTCTKYDKLGDVIEKCIKKRVHRLICIDNNKKVEGILSLSDILNFLLKIKKPPSNQN